jgi:hypothetical protein
MSGQEDLEIFKLEDGTEVATGNIPLAEEDRPVLFSEYPEDTLLDDSDLKKLLTKEERLARRKRFSKWVINQHRIGKCTTSASVGGMYQIEDNDGVSHVPYADNWMYANINGGVDRGSALVHAMQFIMDKGNCPRFLDVNGKQYRIGDNVVSLRSIPDDVEKEAAKQSLKRRAFEAFRVPKRDFKVFCRTLATAFARRQPVVFAMHVGQGFTRLRNGFVVPSRGQGNHAMLLQAGEWRGSSVEQVTPELRNSWGPSADPIYGPTVGGWGEGGFGLCTMEDAFECIRNHDYYVLTSVKYHESEGLL